jgi:hypothetical protein
VRDPGGRPAGEPPPQKYRAGQHRNACEQHQGAEPGPAVGVSRRRRRLWARTLEAERFGQNRAVRGRDRLWPPTEDGQRARPSAERGRGWDYGLSSAARLPSGRRHPVDRTLRLDPDGGPSGRRGPNDNP